MLPPEHHIVRDAEVRAKREVLVDGLKTRRACVLRAEEIHRPPLQRHRTRVGLCSAGNDFDQGALARAIVTEKANHFALADCERRLLERRQRAV